MIVAYYIYLSICLYYLNKNFFNSFMHKKNIFKIKIVVYHQFESLFCRSLINQFANFQLYLSINCIIIKVLLLNVSFTYTLIFI